MVGAGAWAGEWVCTTGRIGGDDPPGGDCDCDGAGRDTVKLGLGDGSVARARLLRFDIPLGLGLRELIWEIGEVNPLRGPSERGGRDSKGMGATTAMESMTSLSSTSAVRISAALSSTDGTDWSSCSVNFPRGMRWGSVWLRRGGDGVMGSISRSKMADDDEWLQGDVSDARQQKGVPSGTYTDVGDEGIDPGEREPKRPVRRCCDVRCESRCSFGGALERFAFEVTCRRSLEGCAGWGKRISKSTPLSHLLNNVLFCCSAAAVAMVEDVGYGVRRVVVEMGWTRYGSATTETPGPLPQTRT